MSDSLPEQFYFLGSDLIKHKSTSKIIGLRRFKASFGVSPTVCADAWNLIKSQLSSNFSLIHLLWALHFLKCYNSEHMNHAFANCDEKTFRYKTKEIINKLMSMKVVSTLY